METLGALPFLFPCLSLRKKKPGVLSPSCSRSFPLRNLHPAWYQWGPDQVLNFDPSFLESLCRSHEFSQLCVERVPGVGVWFLPSVHSVPFPREDDPCKEWLTGPGVRWEMPSRLDPMAERGELLDFGELRELSHGFQLPAIRGRHVCLASELFHDGFQHCVEGPHMRVSPIPGRLVYHQVVAVLPAF